MNALGMEDPLLGLHQIFGFELSDDVFLQPRQISQMPQIQSLDARNPSGNWVADNFVFTAIALQPASHINLPNTIMGQ